MMTQKGTETEDLKQHIDRWALIIATEMAIFFVTICVLIVNYAAT